MKYDLLETLPVLLGNIICDFENDETLNFDLYLKNITELNYSLAFCKLLEDEMIQNSLQTNDQKTLKAYYKNRVAQFLADAFEELRKYTSKAMEKGLFENLTIDQTQVYNYETALMFSLIDSVNEAFDLKTDTNFVNSLDSKTIPKSLIRHFCELVNQGKILEKHSEESVEKYCLRVCQEYNLESLYTDKVRQSFDNRHRFKKDELEKISYYILPLIELNKRNVIEAAISSLMIYHN